jgi:hypothetical protein
MEPVTNFVLVVVTVTVCPSGCNYTAIGAAVSASTSEDTLINVGANTYTETSAPTTSSVALTLSYAPLAALHVLARNWLDSNAISGH